MGKFRCRICGDIYYTTILEGNVPLAADVRLQPSNGIPKYPLHVVRCSSCGHIQLKEAVEAELYDNYLFTPSYMSDFSSYTETFCKRLDRVIGAEKEKRILEIGSSNGSLLKKLKDDDWEVLGIEPSAPMVKAAEQLGVNTIHGYFEKTALGEIQKRIGQPSVVILRHVLEHLDHLDEVMMLIEQILGDGLLVIEVPYVQKAIQEKRFYDFFHEHLSYFSVTALRELLGTVGLHIHHVYETPEGGGSILIFADNCSASKLDDNVESYLHKEKVLLSAERIDMFSKEILNNILHLKAIVENAKEAGKTIAGWGAGQRGCTLVAHCGFRSDDLRYVIDANENYWWRYVPGTDIQIVPPSYYQEHMVDEMLIFATGYADSIIKENAEFERLGGSFIRISAI